MIRGDKLLKFGRSKGIEELRKVVYCGNIHNEIEGMRKFIESRQKWCRYIIMGQIKE